MGVDHNPASLAPIFRIPLTEWLLDAQATLDEFDDTRGHSVELLLTETRRTLERQRWLYAQGRERPYLDKPKVTYTISSLHRWGLAADMAMIRQTQPLEAIWSVASWQWLYRTCPPEQYGLRHLGHIGDWAHLEYRYADEAVDESIAIGLKQT